ncbi:MAG: hypothetical protein JNM27_14840 [Leptospirales bacterium]|nr:hypothetical protein [Leptospirales bacterium]
MQKAILSGLLALFTLGCSEIGLTKADEDYTNGYLALAAGLAGANPPCQGVRILSGTISGSQVTGTCLLLTGAVFIPSGVTLTIPAGAQVYADTAATLFVLKGGKLVANGSSTQPVVFTSAQPVGTRATGDWGGIVMIGKAPTNQPAKQTEGAFPQNYGGPSSNEPGDSSGSLSYVRIEYAGFPIAANQELNCLSLYAVGSGTNLDHVQCHMGGDDSFEFFGGTVNAKFLLSTGSSDDDFDIDEGYNGKLQFLIGIRYQTTVGRGSTDPRGIEFNGLCNAPCTLSGGATTALSNVKLANFTLIGPGPTPYPSGAPTATFGRVRVQMQGSITHGSGEMYGSTGANGAIQCQDTGTSVSLQNFYADGSSTASAGTCTTFALAGTPYGATATIASMVSPPNVSGPTSESGIDLQPSGTVPTVGSLSSVSGFNDSFFQDNTTPFGMISGQNWTSGWTRFSIN